MVDKYDVVYDMDPMLPQGSLKNSSDNGKVFSGLLLFFLFISQIVFFYFEKSKKWKWVTGIMTALAFLFFFIMWGPFRFLITFGRLQICMFIPRPCCRSDVWAIRLLFLPPLLSTAVHTGFRPLNRIQKTGWMWFKCIMLAGARASRNGLCWRFDRWENGNCSGCIQLHIITLHGCSYRKSAPNFTIAVSESKNLCGVRARLFSMESHNAQGANTCAPIETGTTLTQSSGADAAAQCAMRNRRNKRRLGGSLNEV